MNKKYRTELKYTCNEFDLLIIEEKIKHICSLDSHASIQNKYTVSSLYLDDYQNTNYYDNQEGFDVREKYRIRIYNNDPSDMTLECKQKLHNKNHKMQVNISTEQYNQIISGVLEFTHFNSNALLRKFYIDYTNTYLRPKVIIEYVRTPYTYQNGNVRITFDRFVSATSKIDQFTNSSIFTKPILPVNHHILEVKYDEFIPDTIKQIINQTNLQKTSFSKYYYGRKFN